MPFPREANFQGETHVCLGSLKPMQVRTANYSHLWSPVNSLMPGGNKRSYIHKGPGLFK